MALTAGESEEAGLSSTPEVRSPVVVRLEVVLKALHSFIQANGDSGSVRYSIIMEAFADEIIQELDEKDDEVIGAYMAQMGEVIAWIGHGDASRLPANVREFALQLIPAEELAITR